MNDKVILLHKTVMISLFIISGQSVTKLGVTLQVLTLLIFGFRGRFLVCMLIQQTGGRPLVLSALWLTALINSVDAEFIEPNWFSAKILLLASCFCFSLSPQSGLLTSQ